MTEIYKITCSVCNKIYIGKHHIDNINPNNYLGSGKKQTQHLKEHKKENQVKEIILYCEDVDVKYYEEALIKLYDATNPEIGLNISKKSKGVDKHSEETKEKMIVNHVDFHGKNNPMYGISRFGKNNPFYNKKHSEKTKQKMRKSHLGKEGYYKGKKQSDEHRKNNGIAHRKSINVYTKTGEYIKTFESIKQASTKLNINEGSICKVLKNKYKFAGGYIFKYNIIGNINVVR